MDRTDKLEQSVEERIAAYAKGQARGMGELHLEEICIGVGYTGVLLSDGHGGTAYTFREKLGPSCGVIREAGTLCGIDAADAADWMLSENPAKASIGMATVNAILNRGFSRGRNVAEAVSCTPDDVIGMVGWFCPLVWKYQQAGSFYIFEENPADCGPSGKAQILPAERAYDLLPQCTRVVLTGTSFINHTAGGLLKACGQAKEIILVGASTPMCPEILQEYGVTHLAGCQITDAPRMMRIVAQGGGGMELSGASEKLLEEV